VKRNACRRTELTSGKPCRDDDYQVRHQMAIYLKASYRAAGRYTN